MKLRLTTALFFLATFYQAHAQQVETIVSHVKIVDGLHVDPAGNVYTTSGGLQNGVEIGKYNRSTASFNPYFASGFSGPIDIDQYYDSLFVVTNYDNNTVSQYNLNSSQVTTIATGLDGPAGIAIDSANNIYVTNFGAPPTYSGHTIQKITPSGQSYVYIDSSALLRPQAICFNHLGELIVHSENVLYKVNSPDSSLVFWANLGAGVGLGNMAFRQLDSCIYGASGGTNDRIMRITAQGDVSVFSGSVAGFQDGDIADALFSNPLGMAFSPNEDTLYISEAAGSHRLRRILMDQITDLFEPVSHNFKVYPNPTSGTFNIESPTNSPVNIEIIDLQGRTVLEQTSSDHIFSIDVSTLGKAHYILRLSSNELTISTRITVE